MGLKYYMKNVIRCWRACDMKLVCKLSEDEFDVEKSKVINLNQCH